MVAVSPRALFLLSLLFIACLLFLFWYFDRLSTGNWLLLMLPHRLQSFDILLHHAVSIHRKHRKFDLHVILLEFVLELHVIASLSLVVLVFHFIAALLPINESFVDDCANVGFHAHSIQRVTFGELVYAKFYFNLFAVCGYKIKPLPKSMSVCIFPHVQPILIRGYPGSSSKVTTFEFALESNIKIILR